MRYGNAINCSRCGKRFLDGFLKTPSDFGILGLGSSGWRARKTVGALCNDCLVHLVSQEQDQMQRTERATGKNLGECGFPIDGISEQCQVWGKNSDTAKHQMEATKRSNGEDEF